MRERTSAGRVDYQVFRRNDAWPDHIARTNVTAGLIAWLKPGSVIDPACGDGSIVLLADHIRPMSRILLNDISHPNYDYLRETVAGIDYADVRCGDIESVLISEEGDFDVAVLTETLEHLEDPDAILRLASYRASNLVASSPEMRAGQRDTNLEHLWQFDGDGYLQMLRENGWQPFHKTHMGFPGLEYDFQIWVCRRAA